MGVCVGYIVIFFHNCCQINGSILYEVMIIYINVFSNGNAVATLAYIMALMGCYRTNIICRVYIRPSLLYLNIIHNIFIVQLLKDSFVKYSVHQSHN